MLSAAPGSVLDLLILSRLFRHVMLRKRNPFCFLLFWYNCFLSSEHSRSPVILLALRDDACVASSLLVPPSPSQEPPSPCNALLIPFSSTHHPNPTHNLLSVPSPVSFTPRKATRLSQVGRR